MVLEVVGLAALAGALRADVLGVTREPDSDFMVLLDFSDDERPRTCRALRL